MLTILQDPNAQIHAFKSLIRKENKKKKGPWPFSTNKESEDKLFVEFVHTDKLIASMIVNGSIIDTGKLEVKLK
jgi:hypothetical protein